MQRRMAEALRFFVCVLIPLEERGKTAVNLHLLASKCTGKGKLEKNIENTTKIVKKLTGKQENRGYPQND